MKKIFIVIVFLVVAVCIGIIIGVLVKDRSSVKTSKVTASPTANPKVTEGRGFIWGATVRPYALSDKNNPYQSADLEKQFQYVKELFPHNSCVRANVEGDMKINDELIANKEKFGTRLYLILEEANDFNKDADYKLKAETFAKKIVGRYKGKVEYYQLANELSGVMYSPPEEKTEKIDAGYGLSMSKKRYENVKVYATALSQSIRRIDPDAKIVITGHWVLIKPILALINDGVQADIIGWNWGSVDGDQPAIKNVDNYGEMNIPQMAQQAGKEFWLVETNNDNGSMNSQETQQASYIKKLSENSFNSKNVGGYFHFILTDAVENGPPGQLGLVTIKKDSGTKAKFYSLKNAYHVLQTYAASHY